MTYSSQVSGLSSELTPPPEVVQSLRNSAPKHIRDCGVTREIWLINHACAAGADKRDLANQAALQKARDEEREAICHWLITGPYGFSIAANSDSLIRDLRTARRPKPPSDNELALKALDRMQDQYPHLKNKATIRRALERLQELEKQANV